jgi:predicted DCC family thiol-disulfide oxidoreductase YuxK
MVGDVVTMHSFHEPGVLERYPQVDREQCMRELKLLHIDGRVEGGIRAVIGVLQRSAGWRWLAAALAAPGIRAVADLCYRAIARRRYRLGRRCRPSAACATHAAADPAPPERPRRRP